VIETHIKLSELRRLKNMHREIEVQWNTWKTIRVQWTQEQVEKQLKLEKDWTIAQYLEQGAIHTPHYKARKHFTNPNFVWLLKQIWILLHSPHKSKLCLISSKSTIMTHNLQLNNEIWEASRYYIVTFMYTTHIQNRFCKLAIW
jgi:hypothetical protein